MTRIVVTSFGSAGDFNPLLAIARALARRGAEVTFVANPYYAARLRHSGCRFVAAGAYFDLERALASPDYFSRSAPIKIWQELVVPRIRETYPAVLDAVHATGATVVASHAVSWGGAWAARRAGVRSAIVATTPMVWLSRHEPTVFGSRRLPAMVEGWATAAVREAARLLALLPLGRLASSLGAPPVIDVVRAADLNLGVWPDWFRRPAADDPPRAEPCGFVFDAAAGARPVAAVDAFLKQGEPPVVVGFGSTASLHAGERYRAVAQACAALGRRCLLIGPTARGLGDGAGTMAVEAIDYGRVFPRAAVVVHHGGFGTSAEALRAGRPSLVMPFAFDQFDTAARVAAAGLGRWFRSDPTDPVAVQRELQALLDDPATAGRARQAGAAITAAGRGADRAAQLIEDLAA